MPAEPEGARAVDACMYCVDRRGGTAVSIVASRPDREPQRATARAGRVAALTLQCTVLAELWWAPA